MTQHTIYLSSDSLQFTTATVTKSAGPEYEVIQLLREVYSDHSLKLPPSLHCPSFSILFPLWYFSLSKSILFICLFAYFFCPLKYKLHESQNLVLFRAIPPIPRIMPSTYLEPTKYSLSGLMK